ncbi:MAG: high frequency lysogenization protein HflD [Gammaproteobacteria bacterium]|nr:high frequency lysogenization protein HflD [Gammaproteobacteria bacterium]MCW8959254.1 high frequency lysogenization protein HflD [Gammaproteobacteria bacterium]MCW8973594.1 high frequency lysogenization protein HflD [Gammaproteobacteria bacterium]MCW8993270.1 high frequency lysogenization protein HflD [Gammaproteobacteria bacterium]MCW9088914.1 high frequency lysogenization protein HflD [Gammaproteobacteria bacterium]
MSKNIHDRTLALGALFQSAWLVDSIARTGMVPQSEYETCINSLFEFSPATTEAVYGSRFEIKRGLQVLIEQLEGDNAKRNLYIMRYVIGLIQLERKISSNTGMLKRIGEELEGTRHQLQHFGQTHPNVIARLADIYSSTVSTLTPRIMVSGEDNHLQKQENANKVRAVLLTGIRAAILWKQCGGNRWQLLFQRRKLLRQARLLLA